MILFKEVGCTLTFFNLIFLKIFAIIYIENKRGGFIC